MNRRVQSKTCDRPHLRPILALLVVLLLTACTTTFMYRNLDWLIPWYVDGMVDIDRTQKAALKEQLLPLLEWHREEELRRYLVLLDHVEQDLAGTVSPQQVSRWIDEASDAIERVESRMLDLSMSFSENLSDQQIDEFMQGLWEDQEEFEQEYLPRTDQAYREESFEYLTEPSGKFLGKLTPDQENRFRQAADELIRFDGAWLDDRRAWLNRMAPLLKRPPGWQQALRDAYDNRENEQTDEYRRIWEHNLIVISEAMADVLNLRTEKQNERLVKELGDWRRKINKLIGP